MVLVEALFGLTSSPLAHIAVCDPRNPGPVLRATSSELDPASSEVRGSASVRASSFASLPKVGRRWTVLGVAEGNPSCPRKLCLPASDTRLGPVYTRRRPN